MKLLWIAVVILGIFFPLSPQEPEEGSVDSLLNEAVQLLASECPTCVPVRVELVPLAGHWGLTCQVDGAFLIQLEVRLLDYDEPDWLYAVLAHEWAHVLAWNAGPCGTEPHSAYWGIAYAEAYRALWETE